VEVELGKALYHYRWANKKKGNKGSGKEKGLGKTRRDRKRRLLQVIKRSASEVSNWAAPTEIETLKGSGDLFIAVVSTEKKKNGVVFR